MFLKWHDELLTGNEDIDEQHRELFRRVDTLLQACKAKRCRDEIGRHLWYLKRYVRKHFSSEEKLQVSLGFPDYDAHKARHDDFFEEVRRLEAQYASEGGSTMLIVKAVRMMEDWLRNHISELDMEMAAYIRKVTPQ
jgi:hemerythrin